MAFFEVNDWWCLSTYMTMMLKLNDKELMLTKIVLVFQIIGDVFFLEKKLSRQTRSEKCVI